jgi:hypothetical protein
MADAKRTGSSARAGVSGLQFRLGSLLFVVAYAAVFSALILHKQIVAQPGSLALLFFIVGMLGSLWSMSRVPDRSSRRALFLNDTIRNLYRSLFLLVVFCVAEHARMEWLLGLAVIAALPDWIHSLVRLRMSPSQKKARMLKILGYLAVTHEDRGAVVR